MLADFLVDVDLSWSPDSEKNWNEFYSNKSDGDLDKTTVIMMLNLHSESGHSIFGVPVSLKEGN